MEALDAGRDDRVEVDGARLEVRRLGAPSPVAPPVVMLHEGLGSVAAWKDFPERVAATTGGEVLVYSRRGYGCSDPLPAPFAPDFMHREATDVLPALLAAVGIDRPPVLLGHSDGASIALLYAGGLMLVGSGLFRRRGRDTARPHGGEW